MCVCVSVFLFSSLLTHTQVRVWVSGRFRQALRKSDVAHGPKIQVRYDDGLEDSVQKEFVQPTNPNPFGTDSAAIRTGEFCEVSNEGKTSHRLAQITKVNKTTFTVEYAFCDGSAAETVKVSTLACYLQKSGQND